jgi:hypothetical protein
MDDARMMDWLTDHPPAAFRDYRREGYPAMRGVAGSGRPVSAVQGVRLDRLIE